ncbi:hypothetical protein B0H17DRAFT_703520 [Mycena rosella]|uniref:Uncharacterized protein n=1 Tax=Mycena rosella TaxID=1033263 RepID=A0AAD7DA28_MYCRO|nr:hypothetical protein B0H17DRAFT_703520 [Mycena rosella]
MAMMLQSAATISAIFGFVNLLFSIFSATARIEDNEHTNQILYAFFAAGCVNMMGAYTRRDREEGYLGAAFTVSLAISSVFNWITALRIGLARRRFRVEERMRFEGRIYHAVVRKA